MCLPSLNVFGWVRLGFQFFFGKHLPMSDLPYSKGFMKFACREPSKFFVKEAFDPVPKVPPFTPLPPLNEKLDPQKHPFPGFCTVVDDIKGLHIQKMSQFCWDELEKTRFCAFIYIVGWSEKHKSWKMQMLRADSEPRHSTDFKTIFRIMIG